MNAAEARQAILKEVVHIFDTYELPEGAVVDLSALSIDLTVGGKYGRALSPKDDAYILHLKEQIAIHQRALGAADKELTELKHRLTPKVLLRGNALPAKNYYAGKKLSECPDYCPHHKLLWPGKRGRFFHSQYDRQIRIYLDRAPKGSKPVLLVEA